MQIRKRIGVRQKHLKRPANKSAFIELNPLDVIIKDKRIPKRHKIETHRIIENRVG